MPYPTPSSTSRLPVRLLLGAALALVAGAAERNAWPLWVGAEDPATGEVTAAQALGPLLVERTAPDGTVQLVRPLLLAERSADRSTTHLLYPFFTWQERAGETSFTFLQIFNARRTPGADGGVVRALDLWPLYFSRDTGDPATSYRGLLPIAGNVRNRFGRDELRWTAFPLYLESRRDGRRVRHTPWPIVRRYDGAGWSGIEVWPLAGRREQAGVSRDQFLLWPLLYRQERDLGAAQPDVRQGFLPFYAAHTRPGLRDETFLWPFFGYTDRTEPDHYHETRYLWPLVVRGRGDDRRVDRWAPFFTRSVVQGAEKTWILWPLVRNARWTEAGLAHERNQFLYFLYWSHEQRRPGDAVRPPAYKKHLWPLFSAWHDGNGRRQVQALSPFEVFFPRNEPVRQLWSPLFAVYRLDSRGPDDRRWSLLWNAISAERSPARRAFHLGPLFGTESSARGDRVAIGAGLLCWRRAPGATGWTFSLFDFRASPRQLAAPEPRP